MTTLFGELSKLLLNYVLPLLYYPWFARAYCSSSCKICAFSWSFHNTVLGILLLLLPSCIPSILFGMCWRLAWIAPLFFCVWPNHDYYDDDYWGWQTHVACQMGLWMKVPKKCTPWLLLTRYSLHLLWIEIVFRFSQHHSPVVVTVLYKINNKVQFNETILPTYKYLVLFLPLCNNIQKHIWSVAFFPF